MKKVLFVCLGNICRSPTAEAIFDSLIDKNSWTEKLTCDSAGTAGYHVGERPDARSLQHGERRGYHFKSRARQFDPASDFEDFDWIVCMDDSNFDNIHKLTRSEEQKKKILRMAEYFPPNCQYQKVPDPYYEGAEGFDLVLDLLEEACENLAKEISDLSLSE